ncbi:uncharacterized protein CC84DRAFT_1158537 [Paraphaeosphaeria sporulosa]|uniref:Rhodopsin domain-containing protein n=1 Tax=Paraphaeosphaeria sporulosa TaxID=1460663 RepID=A0A177BVE9_9PLEO|nr:uncharacterized protein CC84DRAFT_1158537 [Paraphaeosphaeria sporulosa]OAF98628.1 hypothetical protein CC84DRAFT_1158537 [Paraphaeosphaeria sporulosa]
MEGRGNEVLAVAILFLVLTWLTMSLRIYVRGFMLRTWGNDDWVMLATVFWYLCELLYVISSCTLKIALGIFYLRVALQRWHVFCIKLLMAGTVLFGFVYFFLVMFQCIPVSEFWNVHPATKRCIDTGPTLGITYALGAANAAADWAFGTLPIFIVWSLQMNLKMKALTAGILAFAAIGSIATMVRMRYIHTLTHGADFLYATVDVAIWSTVEPGIGMTAGNMATLRPLLQNFLWRLGLASAPNSTKERVVRRSGLISGKSEHNRNRRGFRRSLEASDLTPDEGSTFTTITGPKQHPRKMSWPQLSRPLSVPTMELEKMVGGIQHSTVVEQEIEGPPRLHLRDSLRNSFTHGTILSKKPPVDESSNALCPKTREPARSQATQ